MKTTIKLTVALALILSLLVQPAQAMVTKKQVAYIVTGISLLGAGYYWLTQGTPAQVVTQTPKNCPQAPTATTEKVESKPSVSAKPTKQIEEIKAEEIKQISTKPITVKAVEPKNSTTTPEKTSTKKVFPTSGLQVNFNDLKNNQSFLKKQPTLVATTSEQETVDSLLELFGKLETWILESNKNSSYVKKIEDSLKEIDQTTLKAVLQFKSKNKNLKDIAKNTAAQTTIEKAYKTNNI